LVEERLYGKPGHPAPSNVLQPAYQKLIQKFIDENEVVLDIFLAYLSKVCLQEGRLD
jgi:hypothetical protein